RNLGLSGRRYVLPHEAPANAGPGAAHGRPRQSDGVSVNQGGQIHTGDGPQVMPKIEAGVDLQDMKPVIGAALEVDLGDASQIEALHQSATLVRHVRLVGDFHGRAESEGARLGSNLPAGELADDLALLIDVDMIALDAAFRTRYQLLSQQFRCGGSQARP